MWCGRNLEGAGSWHENAEHGARSSRADFPSPGEAALRHVPNCLLDSTDIQHSTVIYDITTSHFTSLGTGVAARWQALRPRDCSSIMPAIGTCTQQHTFFSLSPSESQAGVAVNGQRQAI